MNIAFNENRPLTQEDLLGVFSAVIPTSKTKKAEIETMRTFVENGMMRSANNRETDDSPGAGDKASKAFATLSNRASELEYYVYQR